VGKTLALRTGPLIRCWDEGVEASKRPSSRW
jgi:hypothetical protein